MDRLKLGEQNLLFLSTSEWNKAMNGVRPGFDCILQVG